MEPFNIKIEVKGQEVTLTVLPYEAGAYKIIYYGGIIGAVKDTQQGWVLVEPEDVPAGELPLFEPGRQAEEVSLDMSLELSRTIGDAIEAHLQDS